MGVAGLLRSESLGTQKPAHEINLALATLAVFRVGPTGVAGARQEDAKVVAGVGDVSR